MNTGSGLIKQNSCDNAATKQWTFTPAEGTPTPTPSTTPPPSDGGLYAAPNGSDSAAGTESNPTTLASAITRLGPGGTIYMRGGRYNLSQTGHHRTGQQGHLQCPQETVRLPR
jgi:hypothetical protein